MVVFASLMTTLGRVRQKEFLVGNPTFALCTLHDEMAVIATSLTSSGEIEIREQAVKKRELFFPQPASPPWSMVEVSAV